MNKTMEEIIKEQMDNVIDEQETTDLSQYASDLTDGLSDHFTLENILDATLEGKSIFESPELIDSFKQLFLYEVKSALVIGIEILTICIIIGLLKNLSGSFGSKSISEIGNLACMIVIVGLAMVNFQDVYTMTFDAVKTLVYTTEILLPVLMGILISMGQITTGTIMSPLTLSAVAIFQHIIKNIILPAVFISCIFTILNCLTEKDYVNQLAKFLRKASLYITGILITLMSGIISIQGLIAQTSDGLIMGTAKYSLDAFIPIVGGFTADTMELFLKCMSSIKNIVGLFGILLIVVMMLVPILKTIVIALIYKITSILIEPVATKKIAEGIGEISSTLMTMAAILFFSSLLFVLFLTSIINLGGST